ncbi:MAG: C40 family peptidase [Oscillospiraceae bacterium]|nr:C40 family peptidase [Oscillospiraceae bacterium]
MKSKRLLKVVAYLLVCVLALSVFAPSVSAKPVDDILNTDSLLTKVEIENSYTASKVHRSPYYDSAVIGCFKNGTLLTVLEETWAFYKVDCYDMVGYIAKSQVSVNESGEYYVNCGKNSQETKYLPFYGMQEALELRSQLLNVSKNYIGVPYVSGGTSRWGFDCSGYTQYVFNEVGMRIARTVWDQMDEGIIVAKEDLQCGDLVIFSYTGDNGGFASHIGIYVGNDQVIHASSSRGVTISDLNSQYYTYHYQCARRVILEEEAFQLSIPVTGVMQNAAASYWREDTASDSIFLGM